MKNVLLSFFVTQALCVLPAGAGVIVAPQAPCTGVSQTFQFSATVTNTNKTGVNWFVDNKPGGNSTVGTISSTGLYSAPASAGSHTAKAVSVSNSAWSATSTINVISGIKVTMTALTAAVLAGKSQQLSATVCGAANPALIWSATGGTVSSNGLYTAPLTPGTYKVTAKSAADSTKQSTTTVTVYSQVVADFGSRQGGVDIPADLLGAQYTAELLPDAVASMLPDGGFTGGSRTHALLAKIYATTIPNWKVLDNVLAKYAKDGISPIISMDYAPTWLLPPQPCSIATAPSDINQWAQLTASWVAHVDETFPGLVTDYEIWNEPSYTLCGLSDSLSTYISMFAAASQAMRNQAAADGKTIRIGGPASFSQPTWITRLMTDPATAGKVDFVSYHKYLYGLTEVSLGLNWDSSTNTIPLYARTQNPSSGVARAFTNVLAAANNGSVPVYITEYNDSAAFAVTCCRNNPTYGPLWNALVVADLLNTVYSGAQAVPARMIYYAAGGGSVQTGYFCLFGTYDSNMDCNVSGGYAPYPQFYAYKLLESSSYLGLVDGGHMAIAVSPRTTEIGLVPTAFYTGTKNAVVIVNPTAIAYSSLSVVLQNPGIVATSGTYYLLNVGNPQIATQTVALQPATNGYLATISVPPYSVAALSIE